MDNKNVTLLMFKDYGKYINYKMASFHIKGGNKIDMFSAKKTQVWRDSLKSVFSVQLNSFKSWK